MKPKIFTAIMTLCIFICQLEIVWAQNTLNFTAGTKLSLKEGKTYDNKEVKIKQNGSTITNAFQFSELSVVMSKVDGYHDEKITIKIFNRKKGECSAMAGDPLATKEIPVSEQNQKLSALLNIDFNDNKFSDELLLAFLYPESEAIEICALKAGATVNSNSNDDCSKKHFYDTTLLNPFPNPDKDRKPYFVIEHDFSDVNNGPQITKYKYDKNSGNVIKRKKTTLSVGRMATATFKYYGPDYTKLTHSISFKDHNQEDKAMFQSFITGSDKEDSGSKESKEEENKTKPTSGPTEEKIKELMSRVKGDLELFQQDIIQSKPSTKVVNSALSSVKRAIKSCVSGIDEVNAQSVTNYFKKNLPGKDSESDIEAIGLILTQLERYTAMTPPTFQVRNADELQSDVNYYQENESTSAFSRSFSIPILWGVKLDFSSGFIFSSLTNDKYLIVDAPDKTETSAPEGGQATNETIKMKKVIAEDGSKLQVGMGVLSHIYPRQTAWVSLGITTGFMIKENLAVQFPVGGSLMIGRQSRIVISFGFIFGDKAKLSNRFNLNTDVEASTLTNVTDDKLTVNSLGRAGFFGITYNFGGVSVGR